MFSFSAIHYIGVLDTWGGSEKNGLQEEEMLLFLHEYLLLAGHT